MIEEDELRDDDDAVSLPGAVPERRRQRKQDDVGRRVRGDGRVRGVEAAEAGRADPEAQGWGICFVRQINNLKISLFS